MDLYEIVPHFSTRRPGIYFKLTNFHDFFGHRLITTINSREKAYLDPIFICSSNYLIKNAKINPRKISQRQQNAKECNHQNKLVYSTFGIVT